MLLRCLLYLLYMLQPVVLSGLVAAFLYGGSNLQPPASQAVQTAPPTTPPAVQNSATTSRAVQTAPLTPPAVETFPQDEGVKVRMKLEPAPYLKKKSYGASPRHDLAGHDPVRHDPIRHYPARHDPVRQDPTRHDAARHDPVRHDPVRHDLVRLVTSLDTYGDGHYRNHLVSRYIRSAKRSHDNKGLLKKVGAPNLSENNNDGTDDYKDKSIDDNSMASDARQTQDAAVNSALDDVVDVKEETGDEYYMDDQHGELSQEDFEVFEAALHNMEEMSTCSASRCHHPTPFVLNVRDTHDRTRMFLPECVILHRCMNYTGCCGGGNHECVPKRMSIVSKAFLVVDRQAGDEDDGVFHPKMATTISFVNHTECECRERPKLSKCTRTCTAPFRLTRDGADCVCDCFSLAGLDPRSCEVIKDGVVPLSQDGLMCIKNNNCYIPRCKAGEFDVTTGLCPLSDDYSLPAFLFNDPNQRHFYRDHLRGVDFSSPHGKIITSSVVTDLPSTTPSLRETWEHLKDSQNKLESLNSQSNFVDSSTHGAPVGAQDHTEYGNIVPVYSTQNLPTDSDQNKSILSENEDKFSSTTEDKTASWGDKTVSLENKTASLEDKTDSLEDNTDSSEDNSGSLNDNPSAADLHLTNKSSHEQESPSVYDDTETLDDVDDVDEGDYSEDVVPSDEDNQRRQDLSSLIYDGEAQVDLHERKHEKKKKRAIITSNPPSTKNKVRDLSSSPSTASPLHAPTTFNLPLSQSSSPSSSLFKSASPTRTLDHVSHHKDTSKKTVKRDHTLSIKSDDISFLEKVYDDPKAKGSRGNLV